MVTFNAKLFQTHATASGRRTRPVYWPTYMKLHDFNIHNWYKGVFVYHGSMVWATLPKDVVTPPLETLSCLLH